MGLSKGTGAIVTTVVFTAIALVIVLLRIITRSCIAYSLGAEDYLISIALALSIALTVLIAEEVKYGTGQHAADLDPVIANMALKPTYASVPVYNASLTITKCSFLIQYLRLFVGKGVRRACWTALTLILLYGIINILTSIFMCQPISFFWNREIPGGKCFNFTAIYFSNASFNILSDLVILIIPIPVVNKLQLPKRQKIGLILIFGVGAFACVTSILRLHSLYVFSTSKDQTYDNAEVATWSSVETNVGIICACLPTLKPLFVRFVPRLLGASHRSRPGHAGYSEHQGTWQQRSKTAVNSSMVGGPYPLAERMPVESKHDIEYGFHVNSGRQGRRRESTPPNEDGQIKVVQVIQVEHEQAHSGRRSNSGDSSDISLIVDK